MTMLANEGRDRARRTVITAFAAITMIFAPIPAMSQQFPSKPIRLIVAYNPGGATDVQARLLGEKLSAALGQQVLVENKPGASGMLGAQEVVRAAPDGHTLLVAGPNEAALNLILFKSMTYDPRTDLAPVTLLTQAPVVLVASPQSGMKTLQDVLKAAREGSPPKFGSVAIGSPNHIAGELLNSVAKIKLAHIPYSGAGPAMTAVVGNHIPLAFLSLASAVPQIQSGNLQPIAVTTPTRFPTQPNIPTIAEQGFPGFNVSSWYAVLAPAKTPPEVINRLQQEFAKILQDPEVRKKLLDLGADPVGGTPAELGKFITNEIEKFKELASQAGITPQ